MSVNYVALGKRIGYFRMQCGNITQEALASKINRSREFLAKIEKGTEHPSIATLVDIADALCISVDDLLIHNFYAVVISERKTIQCQDNLFIVILNIIRRTSNYFPVSETFILSGSIFSNFRNASDTRHGKVLNSSSTKANLFAWVETLNLYRSHSYGMKHPHSRKDLRISS